jgi:hypothetical protein
MTSYQDFKSKQPKVSNENFDVFIVDDIFTESQISKIYEIVDSTPESQTRIQPWASHKVWDVGLGKEIEDRINEVVSQKIGKHLVLAGDYSFARYSPSYGYKAKLFPHYDTRPSQRVTFDIQLRASEPWGLVVEEDDYNITDNQALVFSGTQQIHWREKKELAPNAEIDMIFCHLKYVDDLPLDEGQDLILRERANFLINKTGITNAEEKNEV